MKTLQLVQGSAAWHAHRATARNASEAPAMLGCSPYMTRAQLLQARHTGLRPEVDAGTQRRFDDGHAIEAAQKPGAEDIIGEPLYPVVGVEMVDGLELSASFDGLTMDESIVYECKTANDELRQALREGFDPDTVGDLLPKHYRVQMEQQLMVCGGERVLFVAADRDGTDVRHCWYYPNPALRAEILAGWRQFEQDLAAYVPAEPVERVTAAPVEALPAVSVRMEGALAVHSNLDVFGAKLREFIGRIPAKPSTEQEFADCDAACKALKRAEEALDGAEANALGQVTSVEQVTRMIADLRNVARTARLASEKVVKARKEQIRAEEVQRGRDALAEFIAGLNATIGKPYMPAVTSDFPGAISGKKTVDSVRAAIDQHLADKKIEANAICGRIVINLRYLREAGDYGFLFPDAAQLVLKAEDDFRAVLESRIAAHKAKLEREAEAAAEKQREKIRQEERDRAEQEARQQAQAATPAPTPAPAPIASPAPVSQAPATSTQFHPALDSKVVQIPPRAAAPASPPTLKLGEISARLGFTVTADFLQRLGFPPAARERAACLYHESSFSVMCDSLVAHIRMVAHERAAA